MSTGQVATAEGSSARIHLRLAKVHACCWMLSAFHLLVVMRNEVFDWDGWFIAQCAAPPVIVPLAQFVWGRPTAGLVALAAMSTVFVLPWWFAARRPEQHWRLGVAVAAAVLSWIYLDLGLGLAA